MSLVFLSPVLRILKVKFLYGFVLRNSGLLYETFMSEVFLAKMDILRQKHDVAVEERLVRIDALLQLQPDNVELQCVKTIFNKTLNLSRKLKFMAENVAERIPWVQAKLFLFMEKGECNVV